VDGAEDARGRTDPPDWLGELPLAPGPPFVAMGLRGIDHADWLVVDGEFYSGHRVHQVSRQITDTSLSKVPMTAIAKHLGKRVLRRLKLYSRPIVD